MAFQTGAFQTNAFQAQAGASDSTPLGTTIIDGANDAVSFLQQEADYDASALGTTTSFQLSPYPPYPEVRSTTNFSATAITHDLPFPSGYTTGDYVFYLFEGSGAVTGLSNGFVENKNGTNNYIISKQLDGTEVGGIVTVTYSASGSINAVGAAIKTGTFDTVYGIGITAQGSTINPGVASAGADARYLYYPGYTRSNATGACTFPANCTLGRVASSLGLVNDVSGIAAAQVEAPSFDPDAFTTAGGSGGNHYTVIFRANMETEEPGLSIQPDATNVEDATYTDFTDYGTKTDPLSDDVFLDCGAPVITGTQTTVFDVSATSHLVQMPSQVLPGDRLYVIYKSQGAVVPTTPSGWTLMDGAINNSDTSVFYKDADGSEDGTTVDFVTTSNQAVAIAFALGAGTFAPSENGGATSSVASSATYNPPSVTHPYGGADQYLYIAIGSGRNTTTAITNTSYPSGYTDNQTYVASGAITCLSIAFSTKTGTSQTEDPGTGIMSAVNTASARTIIIRGACGLIPMYSDQSPDDSYGWDDADYGTQSDPQIEDAAENTGGSSVDDSEYLIDDADYGFEQDPVGDDADLAQSIWSDGNNVEDPTWTDTTDYSTQSDPLAPDADLAQSIFDNGTNVEDPYFTDFTDYGTQTDPLSADFPQDFLLGLDDGTTLEDPTGADWFEYGFDADPLSEDFPQDFPQALIDDGNTVEDATYTDWSEYGTQSDVSFDDINTTQEDFLLGIDSGNDQFDDPTQTDQSDYGTQSDPQIDDVDLAQGIWEDGNTRDDTDYEPYGTQTDPLSPDFPEDFALGINDGTNLEDPTGADWFEYGTQTDPLADDADLAQSIIDSGNNVDDPTGADFTDYGTQSDPLADDVDLAQGITDCGTNVEDPSFTDFTDYGFVNAPLSPDAPEDQILGIDDGTNLDDPTQTDRADYGTQSDILLFLQEDFSLGTGDGLDYQDFTDTADYSFAQDCVDNAASGVVLVPVTGVLITVQVGCFHSYGFGDISDPSTAWTPASSSSTSWSTVSDPGNPGWSTLTDGSTSWSGVTDPSDPGWTEDC